jgi:hypothetical protein
MVMSKETDPNVELLRFHAEGAIRAIDNLIVRLIDQRLKNKPVEPALARALLEFKQAHAREFSKRGPRHKRIPHQRSE